MNTPVTAIEMDSFRMSNKRFMPTRHFIGMGGKDKNEPMFYPNRQQRRGTKIRSNNRKTTRGRETVVLKEYKNTYIETESKWRVIEKVKSIFKKMAGNFN